MGQRKTEMTVQKEFYDNYINLQCKTIRIYRYTNMSSFTLTYRVHP